MKYNNKYIIVTGFILVLILSLQIFFGSFVYQQVSNNEQNWRQYNEKTFQYYSFLYELKSNFGYGGFIHHFKNYVLRKDASRIKKIEKNLNNLINTIDQFEKMDLTDSERLALQQIKYTVLEYQSKFKKILKMDINSLTAEQTDVIVKVYDGNAFIAFDNLVSSIERRNRNHIKNTEKSLQSTLNLMQYGITFIVITLILGCLIIFFLIKNDTINNKL